MKYVEEPAERRRPARYRGSMEEPGDQHGGSSQSSSLFPIQSDYNTSQLDSVNHPSTGWLANASFAANIIPSIPTSVPDWSIRELEDGTPHEDSSAKVPLEEHAYPILGSPVSEGKEETGHKESKKRRKRKNLEGRDRARDTVGKSKVRAWADLQAKGIKDYYFDTRGDRDNLAFGSPYRMDIARYTLHHHQSLELLMLNSGSSHNVKQRVMVADSEVDSASQDDKVKAEGRYWSSKFVSLERRKDLKRLRVTSGERPSLLPLGDFVPLWQQSVPDEQSDLEPAPDIEVGETWDEYVMRRTREFNKLTRDYPHDEKMWISFANFQDEIVCGQQKKSVLLHALEKKISILEKAIELNPDSEELLLFLLENCKKQDSASVLIQRWENALVQHSGSYKLWRGFLQLCQGDFSSFTVSNMRKMYSHALQALSAARNQLCRQAYQNDESKSACHEVVEAEQRLVDIFVNLCKFEWQTGHQELAIGLFQAEIEYSFFSPSLQLSEPNKQRLFEYFWSGEGERLGEDGALGWAAWLEKEEEHRQKAKLVNADILETEVGGWTGWSDPRSEISHDVAGGDQLSEEIPVVDDDTEGLDAEELEQQDDMVSLLEKLGLNLNNGKEVEVKDPNIWKRWSEEEAKRDREQWMPLHAKSGSNVDHDELENEDDEQLSRVVLFEDIRDYIFSLNCEEARFSLIAQLIDFCSDPIIQWTSTNSPSWRGKIENLEVLTGSLLQDLQTIQRALVENQISLSNIGLESFVGNIDWVHETKDRGKFLRNVLLLCSKVLSQSRSLKKALLITEGFTAVETNSSNSSVTAARTLAKGLLKKDRQDFLLCGAYAQIEAAAGNIDLARKVFDMALFSLGDLPLDCQFNAPILYLSYAEAELAVHSTEKKIAVSSQQRAIHILSCLGSRAKYSVFSSETGISSTQLLKAHRGFQEQLRNLHSMWAHGNIKEQSTALVASAALFEDLTTGWEAAARVFEDAFSMALPGRRHQSLHLELLFLRYIQMLQKHKGSLKPSQLWDRIMQGLNQYPCNSKLYIALIQTCSLSAFTSKLRRLFDDYCQKNPSTILWLFSLSFELGRVGTGPRIHGLFERALTDHGAQHSVILWRCYLAYELYVEHNPDAARRIFFRAIHACPWSKLLWLDGFQKLNNILTAKELSDLQDVMRDKELRLKTDIYEILLEDEIKI